MKSETNARKLGIRVEYEKFIASTDRSVSSMTNEFERKRQAFEYKNRTKKKSGVLDMNMISNYKFVNNIFKNKEVTATAKSHGVYVLLDWSGSMRGRLFAAVSQAIIIARFCKKVNIDFEVSIFTSSEVLQETFNNKYNYEHYKEQNFKRMRHWKPQDGCVGIGGIVNQMLTSDMNPADFEKACYGLYRITVIVEKYARRQDNDGGIDHKKSIKRFLGVDEDDCQRNFRNYTLASTPLNACLINWMPHLKARVKKAKIQNPNVIVITDGASDKLEFNAISEDKGYANETNLNFIDPYTSKILSYYGLDALKCPKTTTSQIIEWYNNNGFDTSCIFLQRHRFSTALSVGRSMEIKFQQGILKNWKRGKLRGLGMVDGLCNYKHYYTVDMEHVFKSGAPTHKEYIIPKGDFGRLFDDIDQSVKVTIKKEMTPTEISKQFALALADENAKKALCTVIAQNIAKNF
jgi:hypothetical protein